ncbi:MAG: Hint domain-containing protein, partial [Paracoccaceae bacterium]|nr:Hint domain-containing protein [Paracoccaceae bacterium]
SFTFQYTGKLPTLNKNGAKQVPDHLEDENVYLITLHDYPSLGEDTRLAFLPDYNATEADMNDFGKGAIDVQALDTTPPATPVCFAQGTLIATPNGEVPVEDLTAGDLILTASGASIALEWIANSHFSLPEILMNRRVSPVCIRKGSLGPNRPHSDLWVSPQHRVVLKGWNVELALGEPEVLVAAKHIVDEPNAPSSRWENGVDYYHLLLDHHDIVLSNGVESESMLIGDEALRSLSVDARCDLGEYLETHPETNEGAQMPAMSIAKSSEAICIMPEPEVLKNAA